MNAISNRIPLPQSLVAVAMALAASLGIAVAVRGNTFNDRPVVPQASGEPTLQDVFNGLLVAGPALDAVNDQINVGWFNPASTNGSASVIVRMAGVQSNAFGIYDVSDPNNTATLFEPFAAPGDLATIDLLNGGVHIISGGTDNFYAGDYTKFGFWLDGAFGGRFYTDDDLNGEVFALAYRGNSATTLDLPGFGQTLFGSDMVLLGWEDWFGGDDDFQDFVVAVQGVTPVPEPATRLLIMLAVARIFLRRHRVVPRISILVDE
jgi:hypothetical protein